MVDSQGFSDFGDVSYKWILLYQIWCLTINTCMDLMILTVHDQILKHAWPMNWFLLVKQEKPG